MRRVLVSLAIMSLCGSAVAQEQPSVPPAPKTKLEAFLATKGRMFVKDFYEIGTVSGPESELSLDVLVISEPGRQAEAVRGLRIEVKEGGRLGHSRTSFLETKLRASETPSDT